MEMINHRLEDPVFWHIGRGGLSVERNGDKTGCGRTQKMEGISLDPSPILGVAPLRISVNVTKILRHNALLSVLLMPQRTLCPEHRFIYGVDFWIGDTIDNQRPRQGPNLFPDRGGKKISGASPMFSEKAGKGARSAVESLDSEGGTGAIP